MPYGDDRDTFRDLMSGGSETLVRAVLALGKRAQRRGAFLPAGWDDGWQTASGLAGTTPASIGILGASLETGVGASDMYVTGMFAKIRAGLLARGYATYGDFFPPHLSTNGVGGNAPSGHPWVFDVAPTVGWGYAGPLWVPLYSAVGNLNGGSPGFHYVHPQAATGYQNKSGDIIYWDPSGSGGTSWTWNLNGGAAQTVTHAGSGTMKRLSFNQSTPGWVNGNNVVNFVSQSAAAIMGVIGVCAYPGAGGAGTSGLGFSWTMGTYSLYEHVRTDLNTTWAGTVDRIAMLGGPTNTNPPWNQGFGFPFNNKLLMVGILDDLFYYQALPDPYGDPASFGPSLLWNNPPLSVKGCSPLQYRNGLTRVRRTVMALGGSLLFVLGNIPSGVTSDVNLSTIRLLAQNYDAYHSQYYDVARLLACGIIDHTQIWGEKGFSLGYQLANDPHPTDSGQAARATDILAVI